MSTPAQPRPILVSSPELKYGNIEAWKNIINSYRERHPDHEVHIRYHGERVRNWMELFKLPRDPDPSGFEVEVTAPDANGKDVPKLVRLLIEGASPEYERFIGRELFQVPKFF